MTRRARNHRLRPGSWPAVLAVLLLLGWSATVAHASFHGPTSAGGGCHVCAVAGDVQPAPPPEEPQAPALRPRLASAPLRLGAPGPAPRTPLGPRGPPSAAALPPRG